MHACMRSGMHALLLWSQLQHAKLTHTDWLASLLSLAYHGKDEAKRGGEAQNQEEGPFSVGPVLHQHKAVFAINSIIALVVLLCGRASATATATDIIPNEQALYW
jgi:hypothetical protein